MTVAFMKNIKSVNGGEIKLPGVLMRRVVKHSFLAITLG